MRFQFTLGRRMASGIILMLVLMVAMGTAGYVGLNRVMTVTGFYRQINDIQRGLGSVKGHIDQLMLADALGEGERGEKMLKVIHAELDDALNSIQDVKAQQATDASGREGLSTAEAEVHQYRAALNEFTSVGKGKVGSEGALRASYDPLIESVEKGTLFHEQMVTDAKVLKGAAVAYSMRSSDENWKLVQAELSKLKKSLETWAEKVSNSAELKALSETVQSRHQEVKSGLERHHGHVVQQARITLRMEGHKGKIDEICAELGRAAVDRLARQTRSSVYLIFGFLLFALVLGIGYAVVSIRSTVGRLKGVVQGLSDGASEVAGASVQVSASSQSLAQGASEQAASIEETSSSLEEMFSMTRQNADHAGEADRLMQSSKEMVASANTAMEDLTRSMERISEASDETGKIIKAIDEIAFQTNLLALNAAVEAARAGQAGAGFAVVADEVRNLAMRAAEAARNTAGMIEETIKRVKDGRGLVDSTNDTFKRVAESATAVSALVAEIAAASREQAKGIEQLNNAVAEMDRVVQQTAAGAEESASASEEMTAQADHMKGFVGELDLMLRGGASTEGEKGSTP